MKKFFKLLALTGLFVVLLYIYRIKISAFFYNQGGKLYERGMYAESIASFKRSLKINPSMAVTHYGLANAYREKESLSEAIEEYKTALRIDPQYIGAYRALNRLYLDKEMYQDAFGLLEKARLAAPFNSDIEKMLSAVSYEYMLYCLETGVDAFLSGDKQKGYALLKQAIKTKGDFAYAHYTLGYFYYSDKIPGEAEAELKKAIEADPRFWLAYKLLGDMYFERGDFEEAVSKYKEALIVNDKDPILWNDVGLVFMNKEKYNEAIFHLREAVRLAPDNLNIRYSLASTYRDNHMPEKAIAEYERLIRQKPDFPNVYNSLGDIYAVQGDEIKAREQYSREIDVSRHKLLVDPGDITALNNLAYAYSGIKEYRKAEDIIRDVIGRHPDFKQAYLTLAAIQERRGSFDEALITLDKAKAFSGRSMEFIEGDIARISELSRASDITATHRIHLKNGRIFEGRIKRKTDTEAILDIYLGGSKGSIALELDRIERIEKIGD